MQKGNTTKLENGYFRSEYNLNFVDRWDELINWALRHEAEGGFFERTLADHGAKTVLDIACGTGFHTVTLSQAGFEVTGADGSANMLAKARQNAEGLGLHHIPFVEAEWTTLSQSFPSEKFDAIVCLGNAFTHLFDETDRHKALNEIHSLLNDDGMAIIDQRNYDMILDKGFHSKHAAYYLGETVRVRPESVTNEAVKFLYEYEDGSVHNLTLCPIRQEYVTSLLENAGFSSVERFGDFKADYEFYDPDFIIQVAKK